MADNQSITSHRRAFLAGVMAIPLSATLPALAVPDAVQAAADALAAAMQVRHGGQWKITINHDLGFIVAIGSQKGA